MLFSFSVVCGVYLLVCVAVIFSLPLLCGASTDVCRSARLVSHLYECRVPLALLILHPYCVLPHSRPDARGPLSSLNSSCISVWCSDVGCVSVIVARTVILRPYCFCLCLCGSVLRWSGLSSTVIVRTLSYFYLRYFVLLLSRLLA